MLIRTGGTHRLSNFLLWQCAYTELYFTDKFWPDFNQDDLNDAIIDFKVVKENLEQLNHRYDKIFYIPY